MSDLSFVDTDELIEEVLSRLDHGAVVGLKVLTGDDDGKGRHGVIRQWKGNTHTVVGLLGDLQVAALDCYYEKNEDDAEQW